MWITWWKKKSFLPEQTIKSTEIHLPILHFICGVCVRWEMMCMSMSLCVYKWVSVRIVFSVQNKQPVPFVIHFKCGFGLLFCSSFNLFYYHSKKRTKFMCKFLALTAENDCILSFTFAFSSPPIKKLKNDMYQHVWCFHMTRPKQMNDF